jgi:MinD superfamily P-loop ATPase
MATKELVIISGKGGTGKTSIVSSFATLAKNKIMVDCDVDAADLHLILKPEIIKTTEFYSGKTAEIIQDKCTQNVGDVLKFADLKPYLIILL